jgi:hypothetical protein
MDAHEVIHEVVGGSTALQSLPKRLNVFTLEERYDIIVFQPTFATEAGDVSSKTARVVCKAVVR